MNSLKSINKKTELPFHKVMHMVYNKHLGRVKDIDGLARSRKSKDHLQSWIKERKYIRRISSGGITPTLFS